MVDEIQKHNDRERSSRIGRCIRKRHRRRIRSSNGGGNRSLTVLSIFVMLIRLLVEWFD